MPFLSRLGVVSGSGEQFVIGRHVGKKAVRAFLVIHVAAVMLHSIANDEVGYTHGYVVPAYLVKYPLSDIDGGCLVFNNHDRFCVFAIKNRVASLLQKSNFQGNFVAEQCCRVAFIINKVVNEMLAYPLLGRECYETLAQNVKYHSLLILLLDA